MTVKRLPVLLAFAFVAGCQCDCPRPEPTPPPPTPDQLIGMIADSQFDPVRDVLAMRIANSLEQSRLDWMKDVRSWDDVRAFRRADNTDGRIYKANTAPKAVTVCNLSGVDGTINPAGGVSGGVIPKKSCVGLVTPPLEVGTGGTNDWNGVALINW